MAKERMISAARKELFDLFDEVTAREGARVLIRKRASSKRAVLVDEAYLARLEALSRRPASPVGRFSLFGSGTLRGNADDVLAETRAEQAALLAAKSSRARKE